MTTLTDEQKTEVEKKPEYIELKAELLKEYKSYEQNLEYADDEFEVCAGLIFEHFRGCCRV